MTAELPLSWVAPKKRVVVLGCLSVLLTITAGFCVLIGGFLGILIGGFGIVFFGACTVLIFARAFNPKPVLTVTSDGIDLWRHPFIPWEELAAIEVAPSSGEIFLVFDVTDPEAYIARMSPFARRLAKINQHLMPGTAYLSARMLPEPAEEVAAKIGAAHPNNR